MHFYRKGQGFCAAFQEGCLSHVETVWVRARLLVSVDAHEELSLSAASEYVHLPQRRRKTNFCTCFRTLKLQQVFMVIEMVLIFFPNVLLE